MKKLLILLFFIPLTLLADEFRFPFSPYPKEIQARFAEYDKKLDLTGNDRTKESWGFIESKGTSFIIYTYRTATDEELDIIMDIVRSINE